VYIYTGCKERERVAAGGDLRRERDAFHGDRLRLGAHCTCNNNVKQIIYSLVRNTNTQSLSNGIKEIKGKMINLITFAKGSNVVVTIDKGKRVVELLNLCAVQGGGGDGRSNCCSSTTVLVLVPGGSSSWGELKECEQ
jgi:hypothetical protein